MKCFEFTVMIVAEGANLVCALMKLLNRLVLYVLKSSNFKHTLYRHRQSKGLIIKSYSQI